MKLFPVIVGIALGSGVTSQAALFSFHATLHGGNALPANLSPGWGSATGAYDTETREFGLGGLVGSLQSGITGANIRVGDPDFAGQVVIPLDAVLGGQGGPINTGFVELSAAEEADLFNGRWFVDIETADFPSGEIRGRIQLGAAVPEPGQYALAGSIALIGFGVGRRCRSRSAASPTQA